MLQSESVLAVLSAINRRLSDRRPGAYDTHQKQVLESTIAPTTQWWKILKSLADLTESSACALLIISELSDSYKACSDPSNTSSNLSDVCHSKEQNTHTVISSQYGPLPSQCRRATPFKIGTFCIAITPNDDMQSKDGFDAGALLVETHCIPIVLSLCCKAGKTTLLNEREKAELLWTTCFSNHPTYGSALTAFNAMAICLPVDQEIKNFCVLTFFNHYSRQLPRDLSATAWNKVERELNEESRTAQGSERLREEDLHSAFLSYTNRNRAILSPLPFSDVLATQLEPICNYLRWCMLASMLYPTTNDRDAKTPFLWQEEKAIFNEQAKMHQPHQYEDLLTNTRRLAVNLRDAIHQADFAKQRSLRTDKRQSIDLIEQSSQEVLVVLSRVEDFLQLRLMEESSVSNNAQIEDPSNQEASWDLVHNEGTTSQLNNSDDLNAMALCTLFSTFSFSFSPEMRATGESNSFSSVASVSSSNGSANSSSSLCSASSFTLPASTRGASLLRPSSFRHVTSVRPYPFGAVPVTTLNATADDGSKIAGPGHITGAFKDATSADGSSTSCPTLISIVDMTLILDELFQSLPPAGVAGQMNCRYSIQCLSLLPSTHFMLTSDISRHTSRSCVPIPASVGVYPGEPHYIPLELSSLSGDVEAETGGTVLGVAIDETWTKKLMSCLLSASIPRLEEGKRLFTAHLSLIFANEAKAEKLCGERRNTLHRMVQREEDKHDSSQSSYMGRKMNAAGGSTASTAVSLDTTNPTEALHTLKGNPPNDSNSQDVHRLIAQIDAKRLLLTLTCSKEISPSIPFRSTTCSTSPRSKSSRECEGHFGSPAPFCILAPPVLFDSVGNVRDNARGHFTEISEGSDVLGATNAETSQTRDGKKPIINKESLEMIMAQDIANMMNVDLKIDERSRDDGGCTITLAWPHMMLSEYEKLLVGAAIRRQLSKQSSTTAEVDLKCCIGKFLPSTEDSAVALGLTQWPQPERCRTALLVGMSAAEAESIAWILGEFGFGVKSYATCEGLLYACADDLYDFCRRGSRGKFKHGERGTRSQCGDAAATGIDDCFDPSTERKSGDVEQPTAGRTKGYRFFSPSVLNVNRPEDAQGGAGNGSNVMSAPPTGTISPATRPLMFHHRDNRIHCATSGGGVSVKASAQIAQSSPSSRIGTLPAHRPHQEAMKKTVAPMRPSSSRDSRDVSDAQPETTECRTMRDNKTFISTSELCFPTGKVRRSQRRGQRRRRKAAGSRYSPSLSGLPSSFTSWFGVNLPNYAHEESCSSPSETEDEDEFEKGSDTSSCSSCSDDFPPNSQSTNLFPYLVFLSSSALRCLSDDESSTDSLHYFMMREALLVVAVVPRLLSEEERITACRLGATRLPVVGLPLSFQEMDLLLSTFVFAAEKDNEEKDDHSVDGDSEPSFSKENQIRSPRSKEPCDVDNLGAATLKPSSGDIFDTSTEPWHKKAQDREIQVTEHSSTRDLHIPSRQHLMGISTHDDAHEDHSRSRSSCSADVSSSSYQSMSIALSPSIATISSMTPGDAGNEFRDLRFLIVDDNRVNQRILSTILKSLHYSSISTASNGLDALKHLQNQENLQLQWQRRKLYLADGVPASKEHDYNLQHQPVDIVFMDLQMPILDGWESTQHIRELRSSSSIHPWIIATTSTISRQVQELCHRATMNAMLKKPLSRASIENQIAIFRQKVLRVDPAKEGIA